MADIELKYGFGHHLVRSVENDESLGAVRMRVEARGSGAPLEPTGG